MRAVELDVVTTQELLEAWRDASRAAELADRLANAAVRAADQAATDATAAQELATLAEDVAASAERAAHVAREAATKALETATFLQREVNGTSSDATTARIAEIGARDAYHEAEHAGVRHQNGNN
jgi:methyl-accepting chemotaxis protein